MVAFVDSNDLRSSVFGGLGRFVTLPRSLDLSLDAGRGVRLVFRDMLLDSSDPALAHERLERPVLSVDQEDYLRPVPLPEVVLVDAGEGRKGRVELLIPHDG